jgi:hypothetical protein
MLTFSTTGAFFYFVGGHTLGQTYPSWRGGHKVKNIRSLFLLVGFTAVAVAPLGNSQDAVKHRLGRPIDWSHSHLIASRGGQDRGASIYGDWRTIFRHLEIEQIEATRQAAMRRSQISNRRQVIWAQASWLWFPFAGLLVYGVPLTKRSKKKCIILLSIVALCSLCITGGCGGGKLDVDPASQSSSDVKLDWSINTGGAAGITAFPAKFSFDITASNCNDVIYFTVPQNGGHSTVNVIAVTNPYATCAGNPTGSTPTVKFGIALPFSATNSSVLSLDGMVLYLIESRPSTSGGAILHAINTSNITTNPGTYNFITGTWTSTHTLAAPTGTASSEQLFEITFAGVDDNRSSPYLDYTGHQIFFGDLAGRIHRVRNANSTSASEDTTNFPVACGTGEMRAPVFFSNRLYTTSADGKLYRINGTIGPPFTCVASAAVGSGVNSGELASPMLDVTNNKVIVVTGSNSAGNKQMSLFGPNFAAGGAPLSSVTLGQGSGGNRPRIPAFDNAFLMTNSGNLYVAGDSTTGGHDYLIRVPYNGTSLGVPSGFAELHHSGGTTAARSSPVTEFLTASLLPNPDFVYVGGSQGTYAFMNRISSGFGGTNSVPVQIDATCALTSCGFSAVAGGVDSGIIVDNRTGLVTGATATANIYFGSLNSTVVQLAQQF